MLDQQRSRRTVLKTLGAGAVLLSGASTASGATPLDEELDRVREATSQYRDFRVAIEDGFNPGGPYVPGQGWHWVNPSRIQNAARNGLSLEEPQVLTYADTDPDSPEGHLTLVAAEWAVPVGAQGYTEENPPDLFSDEGTAAEEHWHAHHSRRHLFANGDGERTDPSSLPLSELLQRGRWTEVDPSMDVSPGDRVEADWGLTGSTSTRTVDMAPEPHPELLTLHAWVHLDNRSHPLAESNPNLEYIQMLPNDVMPDSNAKSQ